MSKKISQTPSVLAGAVADTDFVPIVAGGVTSRVNISEMRKVKSVPFYPVLGTESGVTDTSRPYGDIRRFGALGDWNGTTGTDDSAAIRLATAALQAAGTGVLRIPKGRFRVFSDGVTTTLGVFSSISGIKIEWENGSELVVDRTFTGSQQVDVFTFAACDGVDLGNPTLSCTQVQPAGEKTSRGPRFVNFTQGSKAIRAGVTKATNFRTVWDFDRLSTDPVSYASRGIDLGVTYASHCGYGLLGSLSAYSLKATLVTDTCGRSYFVTGFYDHEVHVLSKNHEASVDCLIATDQGLGADGLKLTYTDIESTTADNTINAVRVEFQDSDVYVGAHRNIDIELNIQTTATAFLGYGFSVAKFKIDDTPDTVDRGHTLENVKVHGRILGANGSQRAIGFCVVGTWGAGENVRNIRFRDLRMGPTISQPTFNLASLKDVAVFDNVECSAQMNVIGNTTSKIVCIGVDCDGSITAATSDTSKMDYISCRIGSITNQSVIGKRFINTSGTPASASAFEPTGAITPAALAADQNDYNPSDATTGATISEASAISLSGTAARNITGLLAPAHTGKQITITNTGNFALTLKQNNVSSAAGNRFLLKGGVDAVLASDSGITLVYIASAWREVVR